MHTCMCVCRDENLFCIYGNERFWCQGEGLSRSINSNTSILCQYAFNCLNVTKTKTKLSSTQHIQGKCTIPTVADDETTMQIEFRVMSIRLYIHS